MKTNIDFWYGNKAEEADKLDVFFNDLGGYYSGNIYKDGKMIGDYMCSDITILIEEHFPHLEYKERTPE